MTRLRDEIRGLIAQKMFKKLVYANLSLDEKTAIDQATDAILAAYRARVPKRLNLYVATLWPDYVGNAKEAKVYNNAVEQMRRQIGEDNGKR